MWNRFDLFDRMIHGATITINGENLKIQSMQLEDGSGYNFNLTVVPVGSYKSKEIFVRCRKV